MILTHTCLCAHILPDICALLAGMMAHVSGHVSGHVNCPHFVTCANTRWPQATVQASGISATVGIVHV